MIKKLKFISGIFVMIIINIILFAILYFFIAAPLEFKENCSIIYNKKCLHEYDNKTKLSVSNIDNAFIEKIVGVNLFDNQYVDFEDKVDIIISRNDFRPRAVGYLVIYGKYDSEDNFNSFLETLSIKEYKNENFYIKKYGDNSFTINFKSSLQYRINYDDEYTELQNYFLKINEKNNATFMKKIIIRYIVIFAVLMLFDILILLLKFKFKFDFSIYEKD